LLYTDPSGENIWLAIGILATFFYLKTAHDNTPEEDQGNPLKWTWNPFDWSGENTTIIVGAQGDSDGNFTPFGGLSDPSTGRGAAVGYNSNNGLGIGSITNGSTDIIYPTEIGASIDWTYVDQARNDLIMEERLNAYFNSGEYQFQMDKYLLASNGGSLGGGFELE
jgi:hypothetical protein